MGFGVGSRGPRLPSHIQKACFKRAQRPACFGRPKHAPLNTARLLIASHIRRSFLLFKKTYPKPILSFFKGAKSYLVILFIRSNFHYLLFLPTFENDFVLFHIAYGLAAGVSKPTSAPHGEIRSSLRAVKQGTHRPTKEALQPATSSWATSCGLGI